MLILIKLVIYCVQKYNLYFFQEVVYTDAFSEDNTRSTTEHLRNKYINIHMTDFTGNLFCRLRKNNFLYDTSLLSFIYNYKNCNIFFIKLQYIVIKNYNIFLNHKY